MKLTDDHIKITTPYWWDAFKLRQHRVVDLSEEIASGITFSESIMAMALENTRPITILLHSPGGDVLEGLGIFDTIMAARAHGIQVTAHGMGPVASMAAIILQAATHRVMSPNSRMLLHEVRQFSFMDVKTVSDAADTAKELAIINDRLAKLMAERTNGAQTPDSIRELWIKDRWLWPEEALELGLIDEIALWSFA